jgi:hypothetical protein
MFKGDFHAAIKRQEMKIKKNRSCPGVNLQFIRAADRVSSPEIL